MIALIGSTGSIGKQTLEVARESGTKVVSLAAGSNIELLEGQAREFMPSVVAIADEGKAKELENRLFGTGIAVENGIEGLCKVAAADEAQTTVTAVVGSVGILPTVAAIKAGKRIALANKETMVAAGEYVTGLIKEYGTEVIPVDSEHSAIFQCLLARAGSKISRILLTASGGPFYGMTRADLAKVKKSDALRHPSWSMGAKITIDSATMMNKGLEIIEAMWLFDTAVDDIEVVVHRESIIHSMVEFSDGSIMAQMGKPDMKTPIRLAVTWPNRGYTPERLDFKALSSLSIGQADEETFGCLALCKEAAREGGIMAATLNAANEVAVEAFLEEKIPFLAIEQVCRKVLLGTCNGRATLEGVLAADSDARQFAREIILEVGYC